MGGNMEVETHLPHNLALRGMGGSRRGAGDRESGNRSPRCGGHWGASGRSVVARDSAIRHSFHHNSGQWISSCVFRSSNSFSWRRRPLSVLLFLFTIISFQSTYEVSAFIANVKDGVCIGTEWGNSQPASGDQIDKHYNLLKQRYTNCTYVEGNLEITYLKNKDYDLSFFESITEVTGYVLIMMVYVDVIPLTNLQVIRGKDRYTHQNTDYSLFVALNKHEAANLGLSQLQMPNLHEIVRGDVKFVNNDHLCYIETINWADMRPFLVPIIDKTESHMNCSHEDYQCHESCPNSGCWGPGPDMCQTMTRLGCSQTCDYRCRGPSPAECCHKSCAAGCSNSSQTGCFACLNFTNENQCVEQCPPKTIYNSATFQTEPNPDFKLSYGSRCLDECPDNVVKNDDNCVKHCPDGKIERDKMCVKCDGPCLEERTCVINDKDQILYHKHFTNGSLANCTTISGSIIIAQSSFDGDDFQGHVGLDLSDLENLVTVREITGFLSVQAEHYDLDNLGFLKNLETIQGRELYSFQDSAQVALHIMNTNLPVLPLENLTRIADGDIYISSNPYLCFVSNKTFENILNDFPNRKVIVNGNNPDCALEGKVCHPTCKNDTGCWGPDNTQCAQCAFARYESICRTDCGRDGDQLFYVDDQGVLGESPMTCMKCDDECLSGCSGPGPKNCTAIENFHKCKNVQDGPFCRSECPASKYRDEDAICQDCHANCKEGCTGPENILGEGGCNKCHKAVFQEDGQTVNECLPLEEECPPHTFTDRVPDSPDYGILAGTVKCQQCHPECDGCDGSGNANCKACQNVKQTSMVNSYCVTSCDRDQYPNEEKECTQCHRECSTGCHGGTDYECDQCSQFSFINDTNSNLTTCVSECPKTHPYLNGSKDCVQACPELYHVGNNHKCTRCNPQCLVGCYDDTSSGCFQCKHVNQTGSCATKCNDGWILDASSVCMVEAKTGQNGTRKDEKDNLAIIIAAVTAAMFLIVILVVFVACRFRNKETVYIDYTSNIPMSNLDEERDPISPSGVSPNQAILTIIKETQIKRGSVLGSGAFGTVYKGLWIPEGEQKIRIPVAIKILRDVSSQASEEFLEEAKVMASVDHPCLLRLLCVCMAGEITLITQLMPLGALLDYIRQHKEKIGSHHLLRWSHQIAEGMVYLEEHHLIHRDLAARNVLVQTPAQVKITDFGLAKFLNVDENVYKAQGGKMPIKWLALESIQYRRFSHKSDVWSFGVTLWEIMTFGGKPYDGVKARDVPELLTKGERLQQPPICTIDVYMLMVKCWLEDENSRPSFKQLSDELENMHTDPQRYLVVQHDTDSDALPSPNPSDFYKSLLVEGMGSVDPELLMDAEEYLQPMGQMKENYTYEPSQGFTFPPNNNHQPPMRSPGAMGDPAAQPMLPGPNGGASPENPRKDSTLTRYCQDPIVAKQYERQRSNQSNQGDANEYLTPDVNGQDTYQPLLTDEIGKDPAEPEYQNDPSHPMLPRQQDAYLPLADDGPTGIAVDNLEYHAVLGSPPIQEEVWSPRQPNGHNGHNGALPYLNGGEALSNSTPTLHHPKTPPAGPGAYDPRFQRLYSTPASHEHDYVNNDVRVGGPGESTV